MSPQVWTLLPHHMTGSVFIFSFPLSFTGVERKGTGGFWNLPAHRQHPVMGRLHNSSACAEAEIHERSHLVTP